MYKRQILNRPIYFYMYDLDEYKEELRGFYLDIYKDLPGDIFETEEDLLQAVQTHCYDFERLNEFNRRFNHAQSGNCSEKVCDIVFAENRDVYKRQTVRNTSGTITRKLWKVSERQRLCMKMRSVWALKCQSSTRSIRFSLRIKIQGIRPRI